jgi:hypothetical protein
MTEHLKRTMRSFLRGERPATPAAARLALDEWFGRYQPDPGLLDQEVERHFAAAPPSSRAKGQFPRALEG